MFNGLLSLFNLGRTEAQKNAQRRAWYLAHYKAAATGRDVVCHGCIVTPAMGVEKMKAIEEFRKEYPYIRRYDEPTADELAEMGL
jgi:hypothetical protein